MAQHGSARPAASPEGGRVVVRALATDRNFASYWVANFLYFLVFGGQRFAFVLLVLELTDRAGLAGIVGFALGVPAFFITIPAGVWADRFDRRRMVMVSNAGGAAVAGLVAVLWFAGVVDAWVALLMALAAGLMAALVQPAMTAIVPMLVPRERLMSGIALRTMGQNLAQILGFSVAGVTIALVDFGGAFVVQALTYLGALVAIWFVRLPEAASQPAHPGRPGAEGGQRPNMLSQAKDGLGFVLGDPRLRGLVVLSVLSALFMIGPVFVLLPEVARSNLEVGEAWNGILMAFIGCGMLVTSSYLALKSQVRRRGYWFLTHMFLSGPYLVVVGLSTSYPLTAVAVFLWGTSAGVFMNLTQTLVQGNTPNEMMGRAMSIFMLSIIGIVPLGSLFAGAGAELIGVGPFMAVSGVIIILCSVWAWLTQHELRAID